MRDAIAIYIKFKNFVRLLISDCPVSSSGSIRQGTLILTPIQNPINSKGSV